MRHQLKSLLSTKKQGTFIKNKNCSKLDQKSSKIGFVTPKIAINCSKLTKIILLAVKTKITKNSRMFFRNKNTALCAYKNI